MTRYFILLFLALSFTNAVWSEGVGGTGGSGCGRPSEDNCFIDNDSNSTEEAKGGSGVGPSVIGKL